MRSECDADVSRHPLLSQVVAQAFEYAKDNGYKIIPSCSYIPVFVKRNPEWSGFVNP